jgi:hypothetical protein
MLLDASGVLTVKNYVSAPAFWVGDTPGGFGLSESGVSRTLQFIPNYYLDFNTSTATFQWHTLAGSLWVMRASDNLCFNQLGPVGGNGSYINTSDRRAKTGIAPSSKGLAEVLQLQPVSFTRTDPATGAQEEIGFIAQDVQPIVPEAVWQAGIPLRDGSGGLDSAEPTLGLSSDTLTALNVNAIKELNGLIAALTARIAALEGGAA